MEKEKKQRVIVVTGKRKFAVARATIRKGTGIIRINSKSIETLKPEMLRLKIQEPLLIAGSDASGVDININTNGGGVIGQADAARQAIAKGLVE